MAEDKSGFDGKRSYQLLTGELKTKYPAIVEKVLKTKRPNARGEMVPRSGWSAASKQQALAEATQAIEEEEAKHAAQRRPSWAPELRRLQQNIARLVEPEELPDPGVIQLSPETMQLLAQSEQLLSEPIPSPPAPEELAQLPAHGNGLRGRPRGKPSLRNEWVPFGKWRLALNRLKNEDVLALGRSNGEKIPKHPNRPISAALKVALMQQVKGETVSMDILSEDDREFLEWIFQEAHITFKKRKPVPLKPVKTPKQIKDRLSVLYGEIAEGPNDNPKLKKEFKDLFAMASLKGILSDQQLFNGREFISTF
jgi:hypothetical protein